jgi:hypothetical protein
MVSTIDIFYIKMFRIERAITTEYLCLFWTSW